jgi:hypothetical protein
LIAAFADDADFQPQGQAHRGRRGDTCGNVDVVQAFRV